jgi:hypothetical protein
MHMFKIFALVSTILAASAAANGANAQQGDATNNNAMTGHSMTGGAMMGDQSKGGSMGQGMMGGAMGPGGMMSGMGAKRGDASMCAMMTGHIEGRLAYLKAELKITAEQESLWNDYASAVRANTQSMASRCDAIMGQSGDAQSSLPARLDAHEQFLTARLDAFRAIIKVLEPLYAALSDTQKQVADQLIRGSMGTM